MKKIISFMLLCSTLSLMSCSNKADEDEEGKGNEINNNENTNNENTNNENTKNENPKNENTKSETDIEINNKDNLILRLKGSNTIAESIELDCGISRTSYNHDSSLKGETSAAFPSSIEIDASIPTKFEGQVKIEWTIPEVDNSYFSLDTNTGNTVKVTATNPSRLSVLTAKMIQTSDNSVLKEVTCELRSVMVNTYWYGVQTKENSKICGFDIGNYATGYSGRFYTTGYSEISDVVFPSKMTAVENGTTVTRNVCRIVGLSKPDGSGGPTTKSRISCRNIYIPNTVYMISSSAFVHVIPQNAPVFQGGGVKYTYLDGNCVGTIYKDTNYVDFARALSLDYFPYDKYAEVSSENLSETPSLTSFTNISTVTDLDVNNKKLILQKKS